MLSRTIRPNYLAWRNPAWPDPVTRLRRQYRAVYILRHLLQRIRVHDVLSMV